MLKSKYKEKYIEVTLKEDDEIFEYVQERLDSV
jgi:hypothetical protein